MTESLVERLRRRAFSPQGGVVLDADLAAAAQGLDDALESLQLATTSMSLIRDGFSDDTGEPQRIVDAAIQRLAALDAPGAQT